VTYDPEKLRNLLLGSDSEEKKPSEAEEAHEADEASKAKPAPVEKPKVTAPDELSRVRAESFAPSKKPAAESKKEEFKRPEPAAEHPKVVEKAQPPKRKEKPPPKPRPIHPPSPISMLALSGGGIAILGAIIAFGFETAGTPAFILTGIGAVLLGGFAFFNGAWIRTAISSRSVRYSTNVGIVILSLFGILILVNVISYRYHQRIDLSAEKLHTLSEQTLKVLDDINRAGEDITITAFVPSSSPERTLIQSLVDLYTYRSARLKFSFVDPDIKRELTESKGIDHIPSILFELGERRTVINDINEPHFTSALMGIRSTQTLTAAFLTGHGEPDPFSSNESQAGLSLLRERLDLDNLEISQLSIPRSNGVPQETSLLMIVGPQSNLSQQEIDAIARYLDGGGSVIALIEHGKSAGLVGLLGQYGITVNNDTVLDESQNFYGDPSAIVVGGSPDSPITQNLDEGMLFLNAGSLGFSGSYRLSDVEVESVVRSSSSSWSESTDIYKFDETTEKHEAREMALLSKRALGPVETADASSGETTETEAAQPETKYAMILAVNDASFVLNANFEVLSNRDFILNAANYLTESQDLMSMRPPTSESRLLELSPIQRSLIFAVSLILTPLIIAGLGVWVWLKRK
jgi:ABC-type uncharacterized transport system involved in gliding motility auxiliary subunit